MITGQSAMPLRVVTIGEEAVGKTSITSRLIDDKFNPYEPGTVGASYQQYSETIDSHRVEIQIWDTAGQEKFKSLSPIYFRNAAAAVCVFSLTSRTSFANIKSWIDSFHDVAGTQALVYIAANKCDLEDEFEVTMDEVREWAEQHHLKVFQTSAKTGAGILPMFRALAEELYHTKSTHTPVRTKQLRGDGRNCGC